MSESSGGHGGFVLSERPRRYGRTRQQSAIAQAATACGIEKGMTRSDLVKAMTECIPKFFASRREGRDGQ